MAAIPADTLRIIILPLDEERTLAETGDDENIVVTMIGQKHWLLGLVSGIASASEWENT